MITGQDRNGLKKLTYSGARVGIVTAITVHDDINATIFNDIDDIDMNIIINMEKKTTSERT